MYRRSPESQPERDRGIANVARSALRFGAKLRERVSRRMAITIGASVAVVAVGLVAFAPIARARLEHEAARRHLSITAASIRPGWFAVTLRDVHVRPDAVAGIDLRLDEIRVDLSAGLSVQGIVAHGGLLHVEGEPEDVIERLRDFRKRGGSEGGPAAGSRTPFSLDALALDWTLPSGGVLAASGLSAHRTAETTTLGCAQCKGGYRHATAEIVDGVLELGVDGTVKRVTATSLGIAYEPPHEAAPKKAPAPVVVDPEPPPLPAAAHGKRGKTQPVKTPPPPHDMTPEEPVLPLPDLHALREKLRTITVALAPRLPDGMNVDIAGLTAKADVGGEPVAVGPGRFTLVRTGERVRLSFSSEKVAAGSGTPLSIDADLPMGEGDVTANLSGGPVSLAALGVKEGTKGLFEVAHGTVAGKGQLVLASKGEALTFDGQLVLKSIAIKHARLAPEPLRGLDFSIAGRGVLDDAGRLRVDDATLDVGAVHLKAHGTIEETTDHFGLSLGIDIAPAGCQSMLDGLPQGLMPLVRSARMTGTFGANARVIFDTRSIDKLVLDYTIDDRCRVVEVPSELSRERFTGSFTYRTYHPDGTPSETTTGPGTDAWTALDDISPYMVVAVQTTEDAAFFKHHGFNHAAIRSSVQANLKARRFVRGASTITMQLAKNLFLSRDKAVSRKLEEVVLTDYLEQIFRKEDMIELYLNVIEFGPDVYGVTDAALYYFGRKPEELDVAECFFLASLLPSPTRYGKMRDKGQISEGWLRHVRTLIEIAGRNGKLTSAEVSDALSKEIKLVRDGDPRPEPRKVAPSARRREAGDDADWKPLD